MSEAISLASFVPNSSTAPCDSARRPEPGGSTTPENPHEGEEFGFVLQGSINLHLGERKIRVRREESFCFKPDQTHYIENAGKSVARVLWVSTPPTF